METSAEAAAVLEAVRAYDRSVRTEREFVPGVTEIWPSGGS